MEIKHQDHFDSVRAFEWCDGTLKLLDQRLLPEVCQYNEYRNVTDVARAITEMVVRGAPAIGVTAAYGVVLAADARFAESPANWKQLIIEDLSSLATARPTAVNLQWAIQRMREVIDTLDSNPAERLLLEAQRIHHEDVAANRRMGELGASLIKDHAHNSCAVLTHCNTGSLATGGFGTALGVIRTAYASGLINQVYADETRPWLQGSRLTAWELVQDRIPVTLIADSAAAHLMKQGAIGWAIVGSDRITANGDVINKIGTYNVAIAAKYHRVKVMVVAPTSTIDMNTLNGAGVPIETRAEKELLSTVDGKRIAAPGAHAWNPVFDVTPAELIDAIITEKGIILSPTTEKVSNLMQQ